MAQFDTEISVEESCRLVVAVPKIYDLNPSEADDVEAELNKILRDEIGHLIDEVGGWVMMNNTVEDHWYFETNRDEVNAGTLESIIDAIPEAYELVNIEVPQSDILVMARETITVSDV